VPQLLFHKRAAGYLARMDGRIKAQVLSKLNQLAADPDQAPGIKSMAGEWAGFYRLRHGDLRIIYLYDRQRDAVIVSHIGPRGDVYK
jgi:mRNA interferase RelE/StbE